jgi:Na+/melibiose symporter-like transporter
MKKFFLFDNTESDTRVSNTRLLSHAAGLVGQNMAYSLVSSRLFVFLNTVLGVPAEKTGIITGVSTMWDAINDPLFGSLMDHRKHRPGYKLRPFLLWTPAIIGILVTLMFVDMGFDTNKTVLYILVLYLLFDTFYSFQDIAIWGMASLSSPSSDERRRVTQWISIGAGLGGTIAGLFPMFKDMFVRGEVMSEKHTYLFFACIFGLGGMLMSMFAYRMKEKVIDVNAQEDISAAEKFKAMMKTLANLRYNKTLIIVCLARAVQCFSLTLPWEYFFESEGVSYNVFGAEITGGTAQIAYGYIMGIPGAFVNFFAVPIIKKIGGNKKLLVYSEVITIVARFIAFAIGTNERYKNIGALFMVMGVLGSAQILTNMKDIAHRSLLTNAVDEMELKTGERTEAISFSMQNFVSKFTGAIPKFIQGYMLKVMGFQENLTVGGKRLEGSALVRAQTAPRFLKYRWHQFILGPAIGSALYLIVILFLKDDQGHIAEVERQLKEKREAAALELEKANA